jgi:SAM-dependent methyltransferase
MNQSSPASFYSEVHIATKYEKGRIERTFIKDPLHVLTCLETHALDIQIPLHSFLDWIYNFRLKKYLADVLYGEILDIGCGTSYVYRSLILDGWKGKVTGFDISQAMLDEGTQRIDKMFIEKNILLEKNGDIFVYADALGRKTIDTQLPISVLDKDTLLFLKQNRYVGDVQGSFKNSYDTITGFAGPICFFNSVEQQDILGKILSNSKKYASLQFKNSSFYAMNANQKVVNKMAGLIKYIYDNKIVDSFAFLCSLDFPDFKDIETQDMPQISIKHEVGGFLHYPTSLQNIEAWSNHYGFNIIKFGSMGFASETFYYLFKEYYEKAASYSALKDFFLTMFGIDEFFCQKMIFGENLHVTFVRKQNVNFAGFNYCFDQPYRTDYFVHQK